MFALDKKKTNGKDVHLLRLCRGNELYFRQA